MTKYMLTPQTHRRAHLEHQSKWLKQKSDQFVRLLPVETVGRAYNILEFGV
jgi:hypothetical protein